MENAETLSGGLYKFIYDYLMLSHCAITERNGRYKLPRLLRHRSATLLALLQTCARQRKSFLFGYPMWLEKRNGIMENDETLSGGLYKFIYDYLMLSHFLGYWEF